MCNIRKNGGENMNEKRFKPTEDEIQTICKMLSDGISASKVCDVVFGKTETLGKLIRQRRLMLIRNILYGHSYADVFNFYKYGISGGGRRAIQKGIPHSKNTPVEEVIAICELISNGFSNGEIARILHGGKGLNDKQFHSKVSIISSIRHRRYHTAISEKYEFPEIGKAVSGNRECYYPRAGCRICDNNEVEIICRMLARNQDQDTSEVQKIIRDMYTRKGLRISHDAILTIIWRIRIGILYHDFYEKCLKEEVQYAEKK